MIEIRPQLKQIFSEPDYAWQLLQSQVKIQLETNLHAEDISNLLQLYMRGVEKMNSFSDERQSFFKNKVTTLMTKPNVMKILNNPMSKKKNPDLVQASPPSKSGYKMDLVLKQKKKEIQMRLAYSKEESSPEVVEKFISEQNERQKKLNRQIQKILDQHEEKLKERIKQRKLRTMTSKSRSEVLIQHQISDNSFKGSNVVISLKDIDIFNLKRDEEQFGTTETIKREKCRRNGCKSLEEKKENHFRKETSPKKSRRVSFDFTTPPKY